MSPEVAAKVYNEVLHLETVIKSCGSALTRLKKELGSYPVPKQSSIERRAAEIRKGLPTGGYSRRKRST